MLQLLSSLVLNATRILLLVFLGTLLVVICFTTYKASQPMGIEDTGRITYWQFVVDRIGTIRQQPAKCQQMHFVGFATAVPFYPVLYTYVGLYPDSFIARHTMPHEAIEFDILKVIQLMCKVILEN